MLLFKQCKAVVTSTNSVNSVNSKNSVNSALRPPSLMVFFPSTMSTRHCIKDLDLNDGAIPQRLPD